MTTPSHEATGKGTVQNGLTQALGALEVGVHLCLGFAQEGKAAVDFGGDAVLFGEGCERYWQPRHFSSTQGMQTRS